MKTKELIIDRRTEVPSVSEHYSCPDFNIVFVNCENGFCDSGIGTTSDFNITNHESDGFWEE